LCYFLKGQLGVRSCGEGIQMGKHRLIAGTGLVLALLTFFGLTGPASAQRLGYYPGYRGGIYGGGYYGGVYGAGYFGTYRGGYAGAALYGFSPYGGALYGGSLSGAAYLGTSPYISGYGLNAPYAHAYPYAPYASAYRPYSGLPDFGTGSPSATVPPFRLPKPSAAKDDKGHVVVNVPRANAELLINGNKTSQRGKVRRFVSDALAKGRSRTYKFTARWKEHGTEVERTKTVTLRAGEREVIQFTNSSGKKKQRKKKE
jgi:uncharacterized protein (TIGR03000 family)